MRAPWIQSVVGFLLVSNAPSLGHAECLDTEKARTAYDLGERAIAANNTQLAISNFQEANRLCPNPNTQLAIATAYLLAQRTAEAREALNRYINDAGANADWCAALNMRRQVTLLEGGSEHLLTVNVTPKSARVFVRETSATPPTGVPGCQIQPNGETLAMRLPTGSYTVTALLDSQVSRVVPVDLTRSGTIEITFHPPAMTHPPNSNPLEPKTVADGGSLERRSTGSETSNWTERPEHWLWIGAGVAAATSVVTGIWALSLESDLDRTCGEQRRCPTSAWSNVDKHDVLASVSTVSLVVAAASAATGTGIFFWRRGTNDRESSDHATRTTRVTREQRQRARRGGVDTAGIGASLYPGFVTLDWRF